MKFRHGVLLVFGLFLLGMVPLALSFSDLVGAESLQARQKLGNVALGGRAGDASPLKSSPAAAAWSSSDSLGCPSKDLRLLVVAADGEESTLPVIREVLDYLGTPYAVHVARDDPGGLTPERLSDGCRGFYGGVILTNGSLPYETESGETESALTDGEWRALEDYEARFDVRRVAWYAYPNDEYGYGGPRRVDTAEEPITGRLTAAGEDVFGYLNEDIPVTVKDAFAYLAKPNEGETETLLSDGKGNALAAVKTDGDGRETLSLTFDSSPKLLHGKVLAYGLVDWVTEGLFLGERRVYMSAQVDDVLLPTALAAGGTYRMTGDDLRAVIDWQEEKQARPTTGNLRLDMAYNAYGTTGLYTPDTLTPLAHREQDEFKWISHTYKHLDLDEVDYGTALSEIEENDRWARRSGLGSYSPNAMVTPEYSGLENPGVIDAAHEAGIRYMVGNTSVRGYANPSPNAGIYHERRPSIFLIPRYSLNLFFDVSTPEEWVDEYNERYSDFWGEELNYEEILDRESDVILSYLLRGDMNPLMLHQANLRAYDGGGRTLTGDLIDRALEKYERLYDLPILSPTMEDLGERMADRTRYNAAGVEASVVPGESITLTAKKNAKVPVTGLETENAESYGGQYTSYVELEAGESVTLPME